MTGLCQMLDPAYGPRHEAENLVIGIVVHRRFADVAFVEQTVRNGIAANPTAVWVRCDTDTITRDVFDRIGIEHVVLPLNAYWKSGSYDGRRTMRDVEMLKCDHLLVFQGAGSTSDWNERAKRGVHSSLCLIDRRPPKTRAK